MNLLFFIPLALIIVTIFFIVKIYAKRKHLKSEIDIEVAINNYYSYKFELLNEDFPKLRQWMNGKPIDAFTSASMQQFKTNDQNFPELALTKGSKFNDVETDCFWVLSGDDLHFFSTTQNGGLAGHVVFENCCFEKAELQYSGVLKSHLGIYSKSAEELLPKTYTLTLHIDGKPVALNIYDRLNYAPNYADAKNVEKMLSKQAKYQVVGEKFLSILQHKIPNLQTT